MGRIGICGQMHGVMLWSNKEDKKAWDCIETYMGCRFEIPKENVSALYTWQDTRCERSFLDTLPVPQCHLPTYSGYGCATLFWITRNRLGTPLSPLKTCSSCLPYHLTVVYEIGQYVDKRRHMPVAMISVILLIWIRLKMTIYCY